MSRVVLSPPNAILFVFDPTNKAVVIPPYVDGELTAATASCVSVGTRADVDGDTVVSLETALVAPSNVQQVFFGAIATPGGKVAVVTSQFQRVLETDVPAEAAEIAIWADDIRNPTQVTVGVKPRHRTEG